jgi:hypothetical protein
VLFFGVNKGLEAVVNDIENLASRAEMKVENVQESLISVLNKNKTRRERHKQMIKEEQQKTEYERIKNYFISNLGVVEASYLESDKQKLVKRFPILEDRYQELLLKYEKKFNRPGLRVLACLLNFFENSGEFEKGDNPFGITPQGKNTFRFKKLDDAIACLFSNKVLGGGYNNMLNILYTLDSGGKRIKGGFISQKEIARLMKNYNPPLAYFDELIEAYSLIKGNNQIAQK